MERTLENVVAKIIAKRSLDEQDFTVEPGMIAERWDEIQSKGLVAAIIYDAHFPGDWKAELQGLGWCRASVLRPISLSNTMPDIRANEVYEVITEDNPNGVIRLVRKGKAHFPAKSVHEQMEVDGEVAWLFSDLEHHDSPTFERYLVRMNRYTDLQPEELKEKEIPTNYIQLFNYSTIKPFFTFLNLYFRHLGFLDGMRGFIWSLFSAMHYPLAYFKYWSGLKKD